MDIFQVLILGIIEGITEFLPISSTGHLLLAQQFLQITQTDFVKSFTIIIQLGAICAVLFLYGKTLITSKAILLRTLIAFIPTGIIGFILYKLIKEFLLGNILVVLLSFLIGGIFILFFENWHEKKTNGPEKEYDLATMPYTHAVLIGIFQSIAVIPGVSRSAATIIGGLWLGMSRESIVRFSFLLAIPTMIAASGYDLLKNYKVFSPNDFTMLAIGFIASFITALFAIRFLLSFIKTHSFRAFAYYRIGVAIIFFLLIYVWF
jgi:undecaprenyl-diphosphatase